MSMVRVNLSVSMCMKECVHAGVWGCTCGYMNAYVCRCAGLSLRKPCVFAYMNSWSCVCEVCMFGCGMNPESLCISV